jgi:hypothetical protein
MNQTPEEWKLYFDGLYSKETGSRAGVVLKNSQDKQEKY